MRHPFHLAQILRPQAIRSQVSSRSVVTESIDGSLAVFPDSPDFLDFSSSEKFSTFPASFSSSELSAHQMAPLRSHRALEATPQPSCFFPFVFLLRLATPALRLGVLAGSWQRSESDVFLRRYGRRSGQPSSSSLARRACVHVLPFSAGIAAFMPVRR